MTLEILLLPPCHFPPSMQSRGVRRARNAKVQLVRNPYRIIPFLLKCRPGQGTLRIAKMVRSFHFDGMQPNWFHHACFWIKNHVEHVNKIQVCSFLNHISLSL